uniref:Uncharacterized protein n=1 Tax=Molossus molossus TaxID=27622 RepID=A0A7J8I118_MOLMO|nr:hypothetical protein HJG59_010771 [Molossus molossus]
MDVARLLAFLRVLPTPARGCGFAGAPGSSLHCGRTSQPFQGAFPLRRRSSANSSPPFPLPPPPLALWTDTTPPSTAKTLCVCSQRGHTWAPGGPFPGFRIFPSSNHSRVRLDETGFLIPPFSSPRAVVPNFAAAPAAQGDSQVLGPQLHRAAQRAQPQRTPTRGHHWDQRTSGSPWTRRVRHLGGPSSAVQHTLQNPQAIKNEPKKSACIRPLNTSVDSLKKYF